jgi:hypothetical protein
MQTKIMEKRKGKGEKPAISEHTTLTARYALIIIKIIG